jgi:hypothetical protein
MASIFTKDSIQVIAESANEPDLKDDVAQSLAADVEFHIRGIVQVLFVFFYFFFFLIFLLVFSIFRRKKVKYSTFFFCYSFVILLLFFCYSFVILLLFFCYSFVILLLFFCYSFILSFNLFYSIPFS